MGLVSEIAVPYCQPVKKSTETRPCSWRSLRSAAFGCVAVVKSGDAVDQEDCTLRSHDCYAAERRLLQSVGLTGASAQIPTPTLRRCIGLSDWFRGSCCSPTQAHDTAIAEADYLRTGVLGFADRQQAPLFEQTKPYLDPRLDLSHVAASTGYTRNQISFFLNQVRGQTFYTLLNQLRLDEALSRLNAQRHASRIDEIASASGFNSLSTFYRCFKQKTGCSPKAYLQQLSRPE
ncbi:helix-turn-helix domain-containing protein [Pseudomonas svalbardensis]|uniref:helix-turn-helix domain-containing protein n=1 Tax=Pseudomonas svalbardensis TaxID=3042029 RepID=UPI0024B3701B|nr:helix-turn-helix domain-containing protein [Pseudomonas sp. PMCC200367]